MVVKVSVGLIGKQSPEKIRIIEILSLYLSINLKKRDMSNERDMTRAEKKRLTSIRKEFAELKGAGCIPVLTSFEEYLKTFPDPAIIQTKLGKN